MYTNKLLNAKRYFFISLYIDVFAIFLALGCNFYLLNVFLEIKHGRIAPSQALIDRVELVELFSKFSLLTMLCVGLALVNWLSACYKYARFEKGLVGFRQEKWIAAGWIIPLFNLVKPYQVINEIYKAGGSRGGNSEGWEKEKGSISLLLWWIFWAVTHFVFIVVGKAIFKTSNQQYIDIGKATDLYVSHSLLLVGSVIVTLLWFWVSGKLTKRLIVGGGEKIRSKSVAGAAFIARENGAFAEALAEFEEGRLDKGVWARAFADAGGDESKAKALYIKARAEALKDGEVWQVTQPSATDDTKVQGTGGRVDDGVDRSVHAGTPKWPIRVVGGVAIAIVLAGFAVATYQDYLKRRAFATTPVQEPAAQVAEPKPYPGKLDNYQDGVAANKRGDYGGAVAVFRPLAESGHADSQYSLGAMYRVGRGVPADFVESAKWYRLAANQGHAVAQSQLGMMYEVGEGVAQDYREAAILHKMAAVQGDKTGQNQLGLAYATGLGVSENMVLAYMWLDLAIVDGDSRNRDTIARHMTPQQISLAQKMAQDCKQRNFQGCD
jgi:TPR repeat protein